MKTLKTKKNKHKEGQKSANYRCAAFKQFNCKQYRIAIPPLSCHFEKNVFTASDQGITHPTPYTFIQENQQNKTKCKNLCVSLKSPLYSFY